MQHHKINTNDHSCPWDAWLTNIDIYLAYVDFINAFESVDHAKLLAIMEDMDNLKDAIGLVGYIYIKSTFLFFGTHFKITVPKHISREQYKSFPTRLMSQNKTNLSPLSQMNHAHKWNPPSPHPQMESAKKKITQQANKQSKPLMTSLANLIEIK